MRGSVVKKNDHWYVVIEDKDPATGRRKRRWHSGYRTKREAEAACNEMAVAMQRGEYLAPSKQTVGDFVEEWLDTIRATVRVLDVGEVLARLAHARRATHRLRADDKAGRPCPQSAVVNAGRERQAIVAARR